MPKNNTKGAVMAKKITEKKMSNMRFIILFPTWKGRK